MIVYILEECIDLCINCGNGFAPGCALGGSTDTVLVAVQNAGDILGYTGVEVEVGICQSQLIHGLLHINHFLGPAVVIKHLLLTQLCCTLVQQGQTLAVCKLGNALGVLAALDHHIAVQAAGDIVLAGVGILGHGYEKCILAEVVLPLICGAVQCPQAAGIEQGLALLDIGGLCGPAVVAYTDCHAVGGVQVIHPVLYTLNCRILQVVYQLAVFQSHIGHATGCGQAVLKPPAVDAVEALVRVNKRGQHLLESIPGPLALLVELSRILQTCFVNGIPVVDNSTVVAGHLVYDDIVLAVPEHHIVCLLYIGPEGRAVVNIIIHRHEHAADCAPGECVQIAGREEVDALVAVDGIGQRVVSGGPVDHVVFDLSAVALLENCQLNGGVLAGAVRVDVPVGHPLDGLVLQLAGQAIIGGSNLCYLLTGCGIEGFVAACLFVSACEHAHGQAGY